MLVDVVDEAVEVFCVLLVVEDGKPSAFLVVTMLLIGAMSSRNGSSGAGVDVDAFLADSDEVTDEEVVVDEPGLLAGAKLEPGAWRAGTKSDLFPAYI